MIFVETVSTRATTAYDMARRSQTQACALRGVQPKSSCGARLIGILLEKKGQPGMCACITSSARQDEDVATGLIVCQFDPAQSHRV